MEATIVPLTTSNIIISYLPHNVKLPCTLFLSSVVRVGTEISGEVLHSSPWVRRRSVIGMPLSLLMWTETR